MSQQQLEPIDVLAVVVSHLSDHVDEIDRDMVQLIEEIHETLTDLQSRVKEIEKRYVELN
jgi:hypothetical protein